jgi:hypothetical protein
MALTKVQEPEVGATITQAFVQKMKATTNFDGNAPADSGEPAGQRDFVAFFEPDTGEIIFSNPGPDTTEGTLTGNSGGLFTFNHKQPIIIEQFLALFGASVTYTLSIVTADGEVVLATEAGVTSALICMVNDDPNWRAILMPGDKLKLVTTVGTATNAVVRINVRLGQQIS